MHCKHWKHAFVQISLDSKRGCGFAVDKRPPIRYYDPATKKWQRKFLGKWHMPADGVTRSGVLLQTRTKNGLWLWRILLNRVPKVQSEQSLNLSGKRTEWVKMKLTIRAHFSPELSASGAFFVPKQRKKEVMENGSDFDQWCCCGKRHSV